MSLREFWLRLKAEAFAKTPRIIARSPTMMLIALYSDTRLVHEEEVHESTAKYTYYHVGKTPCTITSAHIHHKKYHSRRCAIPNPPTMVDGDSFTLDITSVLREQPIPPPVMSAPARVIGMKSRCPCGATWATKPIICSTCGDKVQLGVTR